MSILVSTKKQVITAGSTSAVDIAHGLGTTPQLALGFWVGAAAGLNNGDSRWGAFATDGTRHFSISNTEDDGATTGSPCACTARDSGILVAEQDPAANGLVGQLDFTSLGATNLRVTPSDAFPTDIMPTVVFVAGLTNVYVDAFTTPATSADLSRTGCGFTPEWGIMIWGLTGSTMNANGGRSHLSIGAFTAAAQWCAWKGHEEAGSNYTYDAIKTGSCGLASANGTSFIDELAFLAFQSGGGTVDRVSGSTARPMCIIWGAGGHPIVGTFALRATTGTISVPTTGHASKFLLCAANPPATATESAPAEPGEMMIGVAAGASDRRAMWMLNHNAEPVGGGSPTEVMAFHTDDKLLERRARSGTDTTTQAALVDIQSIAQDAVTLDQTVTEGTASLVGYFSLGDSPASNPGTFYRQMMETT